MTGTFHRKFTVAALAVVLVGAASAQEFPTKPIRLIVPYAAGGPTDGLARMLGEGLHKRLKQVVVVENKPGGGSIIGVDQVAKSRGDGYTLLFATGAPFIINPALNAKLPYKVQDFAPIATVASYSMVLATGKNQPFGSLPELLKYARSHPGKLSYGSAGAGTSNHLAGELLAHAAGLEMIHTPYRGNAQAMTDVIAGNLGFMFDMPATTLQHVQSGRVKLLGSTSVARNPLTPDVPTIEEGGLPSYDVTSWCGLFAPAGTPAAVVQQLNRAANDAMSDPDVAVRLQQAGYEFKAETPAQVARRIETESVGWAALIRKANIKVD
ncbi:tripartite tricarboxylate transporter substrate binding protein [Pantoea sp. 18069]|uniref:Bug family tripartite tricarboxylate transporter substrate binding protein n=1 Tax=Pantoea sp. 18069 TaxID=2681415 RepID=UPI001356CC67|nr:tripartite tricarboxylate transporter substrate binding protein [Pantoea sp. 18069]